MNTTSIILLKVFRSWWSILRGAVTERYVGLHLECPHCTDLVTWVFLPFLTIRVFWGNQLCGLLLFFAQTFATLGIFRRYDSNETWYNLGWRLGITCWVLQLQTSRRWIPVTEGSASPLCPLFWWAFARLNWGEGAFFFLFFWGGVGLMHEKSIYKGRLYNHINHGHGFSLIRPY